MSPRTLFRSFAVAEVVTWSLLIAGMLLKYVARVGDWPVSIAGPIHGFVFLAYLVAGVVVAVNQRWSAGVTLAALASAVVPYASVPVERWIDRSGRLRGTGAARRPTTLAIGGPSTGCCAGCSGTSGWRSACSWSGSSWCSPCC
nr:hypothetical protein GCM10025699_72190 [Microbacterium flavescens]